MCGRYIITSPVDAIRQLFGVEERPNLAARYNVAPTDAVPIVRRPPRAEGRELVTVRWGLIPAWAKDARIGARMINARAETVATNGAFAESFARRRCLIPADGFYEWLAAGKERLPWLIRRRDRALFAFAGLWSFWRDPAGAPVPSCTIVTTTANAVLAPLHDRMPVILDPADHEAWLAAEPEAALALLRPAPDDLLDAIRVGTRVNAVRNDDPSLLDPTSPDQPALL